MLRDETCDSCLRATQRRQPPSGHLPREEGLWYFDVWHNSTSFIHGGHTAVIGFVHSTTNFPYTIRLKRRSESPAAFDMLCAYVNSVGGQLSWVHTDNALELSKSKAMVSRVLERQVRVTTTNDHRSRQNAIIERFWETATAMCRSSAADACSGGVHACSGARSTAADAS